MSYSTLLSGSTINPKYLPASTETDAISPFDIINPTQPNNKLSVQITPNAVVTNNFQAVFETPSTADGNVQFYNPNDTTPGIMTADIMNGVTGVTIGCNNIIRSPNFAGIIQPYNAPDGIPIIAQTCQYWSYIDFDPDTPGIPPCSFYDDIVNDNLGSNIIVNLGNAQGLGTVGLRIDGFLTDTTLLIGSSFCISIPDNTNNTNLAILWKGNIIFTINAGDTKQYYFARVIESGPGVWDFIRIERA